MIVSSKLIGDVGAYEVDKSRVSVNVHDSEYGEPSVTLSFGSANTSVTIHASEANCRDLATALHDAAAVLSTMRKEITA